MNERPSTQLGQLALAILLIVGVFAGGVAIAFAASDDVPEVRTATATEVDETAGVSDTATESANQTEAPEPAEPPLAADLDTEADAALNAESSCFFEPSPEDIAEMAAENAELAALLDRYGIEYEEVDYPDGFSSIEYNFSNPVVESLVQSFYEDRYAPSEEELAEMQAVNQALIDAFDAADMSYDFEEFDGHSWVDWDYEDDAANAVADEILEDLQPDFEELDIDFEEHCFDEEWEPTEDELAEMNELNDALTAALDEAGVSYERIVEGPFEWIEWDYDDEAANEVANGVFEEVYGPIDECAVLFGEFEEFGSIADTEILEEYEPSPDDFAEFPEGEFFCDEIVDQGLVDGDFIDDEFIEGDYVEGFAWPGDIDDAARNDTLRVLAADLEVAGVDVNLHEEDEEFGGWVWVTFDFENDAAIAVVQAAVSTTN